MNKYSFGLITIALGIAVYISAAADSVALGNTAESSAATQLTHRLTSVAMEINGASKQSLAPSFDEQVTAWIDTLAKQQGFEDWRKADWNRYPMGPGTHSWIVIIHRNGNEVGYIVVSSSPEGEYQLSEYGTGIYPLFSLKTLYRSMIQHELIANRMSFQQFKQQSSYTIQRFYVSAMLAVWQVSSADDTWFFDAKTGEQYPIREQDLRVKDLTPQRITTSTAVSAQLDVVRDRLLPTFDAFESINWLKNDPIPVKQLAGIESFLMQSSRITYVAQLLNKRILVALPIIGYHVWNDEQIYWVADQEGARYIPQAQLNSTGHYFK